MKPYYAEVVQTVLDGAKRAVKYVSSKEVVRAVRRSSRSGDKPRKNEKIQILLTIGRPNYLEREFIMLCKKAGEPFPVKNIQVKTFTPKKNKLK